MKRSAEILMKTEVIQGVRGSRRWQDKWNAQIVAEMLEEGVTVRTACFAVLLKG